VLPASVAGDAERLARFQREAEVLAALNHPNIAAIYGLERADRTLALVMELVEGPTLADRIAQGAIPIDEALPTSSRRAFPRHRWCCRLGRTSALSRMRLRQGSRVAPSTTP